MQAFAAASDCTEELLEVGLERREDLVGPVLHLQAGLARLSVSFFDDLLGLALGELDDLGL